MWSVLDAARSRTHGHWGVRTGLGPPGPPWIAVQWRTQMDRPIGAWPEWSASREISYSALEHRANRCTNRISRMNSSSYPPPCTKPHPVFGSGSVFVCFFCFKLDYFVLLLFAFVVLGLVFFSTTPRDWLGRMSPKWPIFCQMGRKMLKILIASVLSGVF